MSATTLPRLLEAHPRTTGVLFAVALLLVQAGNVLAGGGAKVGP